MESFIEKKEEIEDLNEELEKEKIFSSYEIKEIDLHAKLTCLASLSGFNLICVGDELGRISFYDNRVNKVTKLYLSNRKKDINFVKSVDNGNFLFFSQENRIHYLDMRKQEKNFILKNENLEKTIEINEFQIYEINDFDVLLYEKENLKYPKCLLFNDQDNDIFIFFDIETNRISDNYKLPSAFTQTFLNRTNCLICAFDGAILNYDMMNRNISSKNNIKKLIKSAKIENFYANPPFIHKILYNEKITPNNIFIALLNGTIISLNQNSKKNYLKSVYNCNILDLKFFRDDCLVTLGKDYKIKFLDINKNLETKFYIELNESATFLETWDNSEIDLSNQFQNVCLDSQESKNIGFNFCNEIYFIESNSKKLKQIKIK